MSLIFTTASPLFGASTSPASDAISSVDSSGATRRCILFMKIPSTFAHGDMRAWGRLGHAGWLCLGQLRRKHSSDCGNAEDMCIYAVMHSRHCMYISFWKVI